MVEHEVFGIRFLTYEMFDRHLNVTNVVTTRHRGRSEAPFGSLNLALHVGDDPDTVLENRAIVSQLIGFEPETFTVAEQVHSSHVAVVGTGDRGKGAIIETDAIPLADAMITRAPDVPLTVLIADCVALSFFDPERNAIGIAHAGWAGTLHRIAEKTVGKMAAEFDTDPSNVEVAMSPSIGPCHYEVGEDVAHAFEVEFGDDAGNFIKEYNEGNLRLDLWHANKSQLIRAGVHEKNIEVAGLCTACQTDVFYSHRAEKGGTGRFAGIMMLHFSGSRHY
ncbi:MAG: peptidoglycan editing factor PgeF [Candidatus Latescibacterota bacterium]|nr:MAG: peptidoglycan editing factor PgeF [Candidatus Latescibacterota bacterium]